MTLLYYFILLKTPAVAGVFFLFLKQAGDAAVGVHVDIFGGGDLRQAGHGEDVAGEDYYEAGAGGDLHVFHGDGEMLGGA